MNKKETKEAMNIAEALTVDCIRKEKFLPITDDEGGIIDENGNIVVSSGYLINKEFDIKDLNAAYQLKIMGALLKRIEELEKNNERRK